MRMSPKSNLKALDDKQYRRTYVMAKMKAVDAAVLVLEREGVSVAFGVPGAAINPLYAALRKRGSIRHVLARHVEGACDWRLHRHLGPRGD
jgi:hypothetical protein